MPAAENERLKRRDRGARYVWELDERDLEAIAATEPPEEAARYNREIEP